MGLQDAFSELCLSFCFVSADSLRTTCQERQLSVLTRARQIRELRSELARTGVTGSEDSNSKVAHAFLLIEADNQVLSGVIITGWW